MSTLSLYVPVSRCFIALRSHKQIDQETRGWDWKSSDLESERLEKKVWKYCIMFCLALTKNQLDFTVSPAVLFLN